MNIFINFINILINSINFYYLLINQFLFNFYYLKKQTFECLKLKGNILIIGDSFGFGKICLMFD